MRNQPANFPRMCPGQPLYRDGKLKLEFIRWSKQGNAVCRLWSTRFDNGPEMSLSPEFLSLQGTE